MQRVMKTIEGYNPNTYRSPEAIRANIRDITEKIKEINENLNARELIASLFGAEDERQAKKLARNVSDLTEYAESALAELRELEVTLDELKRELLFALGIYE